MIAYLNMVKQQAMPVKATRYILQKELRLKEVIAIEDSMVEKEDQPALRAEWE